MKKNLFRNVRSKLGVDPANMIIEVCLLLGSMLDSVTLTDCNSNDSFIVVPDRDQFKHRVLGLEAPSEHRALLAECQVSTLTIFS